MLHFFARITSRFCLSIDGNLTSDDVLTDWLNNHFRKIQRVAFKLNKAAQPQHKHSASYVEKHTAG